MAEKNSTPLVGIGFGPAGIALSVALTDDARCVFGANATLAGQAVFLERAPSSAWQPGMVLPGTDIQHHFLRDFATPRYPDSEYTFVRYLHDVGRFYPFTLRSGYVSRQEWSDYCQWVASRSESDVRYKHEVVAVEPVTNNGSLDALEVVARDADGGEARFLTPAVVLGTGHVPYVPPAFAAHVGNRVFHSTQFGWRWPAIADTTNRVLVVGAGQNAGEILLHLFGSTTAQVHSIVRNSGFRMYDLGHFANQAYWPAETDYFHALDPLARQQIHAEQRRTNYAAVDPDVSTGLYEAWYAGEVSGDRRLYMHNRTEIVDAHRVGDTIRVTARERWTGEDRSLTVDAVILCTGFSEASLPAVLGPLDGLLDVAEDGVLATRRDFRVPLAVPGTARLYLNGMSESRHGIASATSFSLLATRAGEIAASLRAPALNEDHLKESAHANL